MLSRCWRAKHHAVVAGDDPPPSQDLDDWSVKPRGPGPPARRARRAAGRARRRRPPMPAMGHKGGASLRGAIAHTERHPTGRQQRYELLAHGWGQRPGALAHLHAQEERALGSARRSRASASLRSPQCEWGLTGRRRPRGQRMRGGGKPGAWERALAPCSQASQSGVGMQPDKGWGAGEHVRRGGAGGRSGWGMALGASGHQPCLRRQTNTRATRSSWDNNRGGAILRSSCTGMKADPSPAVTRSRIIRCLQVQDRAGVAGGNRRRLPTLPRTHRHCAGHGRGRGRHRPPDGDGGAAGSSGAGF